MKSLSEKHVVYSMSSSNPPSLTVSQGEIFSLKTEDCYGGKIKKESDLFTDAMRKTVNPATGPVFISGAIPGDIIEVKIIDIKVDKTAVMYIEHGAGPAGGFIEGKSSSILEIKNSNLKINDSLSLPINPMIGVIGTAPARGHVSNSTPGEHGGNMDCKVITAGTSVYLPVNIEGALLSAGDIHALMGDGETATCAAETTGTITMQVRVFPEKIPTPAVRSEDFIYFIASAPTLDECEKLVIAKAADFLIRNRKTSSADAAKIMSLAGDLQVCQVVNPLKTMRFALPSIIIRGWNI